MSISDQIINEDACRDKLAGNASSNSLVIQDFDSELAALRRAIIACSTAYSTLEIQPTSAAREPRSDK